MSSTVADLYDDDLDAFESDLEDARMQADSDWDENDAGPYPMCAGCGQIEVCPECRQSLEQAGILKPKEPRIQIGTLDV